MASRTTSETDTPRSRAALFRVSNVWNVTRTVSMASRVSDGLFFSGVRLFSIDTFSGCEGGFQFVNEGVNGHGGCIPPGLHEPGTAGVLTDLVHVVPDRPFRHPSSGH